MSPVGSLAVCSYLNLFFSSRNKQMMSQSKNALSLFNYLSSNGSENGCTISPHDVEQLLDFSFQNGVIGILALVCLPQVGYVL
jgi:hypothetical protein